LFQKCPALAPRLLLKTGCEAKFAASWVSSVGYFMLIGDMLRYCRIAFVNFEARMINIADVKVRNDFRPGDLGYVIHWHGRLYGIEYDYGVAFEMYVAQGMSEFYQQYDPNKDRVWICEHGERMVGFLLLMHREEKAAQLRYFLID